jgi:hypothetical protein
MNEGPIKDGTMSLRKLSRRAFLPGLIVGIAGLNTLLIRRFIPRVVSATRPQERRNPRHPLHKTVFTTLGLSPGFYLNTVSGVIHYFSEKATADFYKKNNDRLKLVDPTRAGINFPNPRSSKPRVNLSRASFFFEQAAAVRIQKEEIESACDLLLFAIQYELQSAYRTSRANRFLPYKKSPSYRLYDLLAGVSVRFDKKDYLDRIVEMIKKSPDLAIAKSFETRITKWQDSNSKWHSRWSNTNKPIIWIATNGLALPM